MGVAIVIVSADAQLRRALLSRLGSALDASIEVRPEPAAGRPLLPSDVIIVPAAELSAAKCRELAQGAMRIVVLAAFPRQIDEASYLAAGAAAYVPMAVDARPLIDAVRQLALAIDAPPL